LPARPSRSVARNLQVVGFRLGEDEYAFHVRDVVAVERFEGLASLAAAVPGVVGAMEFRGGLVPVVCLRTRFHLGSRAADDDARVVIASRGRQPLGFLVDSVAAVRRVEAAAFDEAAGLSLPTDGDFILGVVRADDRLVLVLDSATILDSDETAALQQALEALQSVG
jgi:purine-binding chemotaxis protein CheW